MTISLEKIVVTAIMSALIIVGALVSIPIPGLPPVVLSNFFSLMAGFILGPHLGALAIGVYLILGFLGLPVFASGGSGLAYVLGPTGGYLIGFLIMAILAGLLRSKDEEKGFGTYLRNSLVGVGAIVFLYLLGTPWFAITTERSIVDAALVMQLFFYKDLVLGILAGIIFTAIHSSMEALMDPEDSMETQEFEETEAVSKESEKDPEE